MKVMWNIRLFKGMQLLPRQVSDGDRRMDVYVKMVLVDNGQPKSYAIKVTPPSSMHLLIKVTKPYDHGSIVRSNQARHSIVRAYFATRLPFNSWRTSVFFKREVCRKASKNRAFLL